MVWCKIFIDALKLSKLTFLTMEDIIKETYQPLKRSDFCLFICKRNMICFNKGIQQSSRSIECDSFSNTGSLFACMPYSLLVLAHSLEK